MTRLHRKATSWGPRATPIAAASSCVCTQSYLVRAQHAAAVQNSRRSSGSFAGEGPTRTWRMNGRAGILRIVKPGKAISSPRW